MSAALSPEQQAAFDQLQVGISYDQWVWYQARRIDGRYLTHSVAVLLIYDFFITLGEEIRYVWLTKPRFSFAKALWFLNRYIPLASVCIRIWAMAYMVPPKAACNIAIQFTAWTGMVSVAVVDILLMLRVWALYNGSRKVMWYLIAIFFIGFPAAIAIRQVPPIPSIPLVTAAPKTVTICKRSPPSELFSLFTMALAIETVIFAMVIYKAWGQQFKQSTPILTVLVRDGALYYAAITAVLAFMIAATMIPILYQPIADSNLNVPLSSLACNRLILSLRGTYFKAGGGDAETLTSSHGMLGRPRKGSRSGYSRDIHLENIHVTSPSTSTPLRGLVSSDIRSEAGPTSPSPGPARRHSKSRSLADMYNNLHKDGGGGGSPASPNSFVAKVTITQTKKVTDDDGYEYEVTSPKSAARARRREGTKNIDWWDLYEESDKDRDLEQQGDIPRVYDTRVGYYHGKEDEPSSSPEGSGVGRAS